MATTKEYAAEAPLGVFAIAVHLGLASFGIAAWLTGSLADDYKKAEHTGFTLHGWVGMGLAIFIILRVLLGIWGPRASPVHPVDPLYEGKAPARAGRHHGALEASPAGTAAP